MGFQDRARWGRVVGLLLIGILIGSIIGLSPVGAHVSTRVTHLWSKHIRPRADARYERKADVLYASVAANGALGVKKGAVSAAKLLDGNYAVIFNRNVSQCVSVGTVADTVGGSGQITAEPYNSDANGVFVTTSSPTGTAADNEFNLVVTCG